MYLFPVKTEMDFQNRREQNNVPHVPEITDLLRYWQTLERFGGKTLEVDYFKLKRKNKLPECGGITGSGWQECQENKYKKEHEEHI